MGGTADGEGGNQGNANVFNQAGDNTAVLGNGNNRFAIRVKGSARSSISVAGFQSMEMYANYAGASTDVQPGPGRPCGRDEDAEDRLLRHR